MTRIEIHVRPGASKTRVGGEHDGALVVRVSEAAEGGRATEAALLAVARALDLPLASVTLVRGSTSRRKLIEIADDLAVGTALERLRNLC